MNVPITLTLPECESLGNAVAVSWGARNFDSHALPEIAAEALLRRSGALSAEPIIRWIMSAPWLPPQPALDHTFADLEITLYHHPRFYIQALFWADGTPDVHQHAFSGAFRVLEGSSIQSQYRFDVTSRVNAHMLLGDLVLTNVVLLNRGNVELIRSGSEVIHSVFHLETPSVTVVIRTHSDVEAQPQYIYYRPYLALNPSFKDPEAIRRVQALSLLDRLRSPMFDEVAAQALEKSELSVVYRLLEFLRTSRAGALHFDQWVDLARRTHGRNIDKFEAAIVQRQRERMLRVVRGRITSPMHRFLLALLMNLSSRNSILSLIRSRIPDADPRALITQWVTEMSGLDLDGEFDRTTQLTFRMLLDGLAESEIRQRIVDCGVMEISIEEVAARCAGIRQSMILKPLFNESDFESGVIAPMMTMQVGHGVDQQASAMLRQDVAK